MKKIIFNRHSHLFLWLPVTVYYGLVFVLSHSNPSAIIGYSFPFFDKIIHFFEYSFFGLLLARAFFWEKQVFHRIHHIRLAVIASLIVAALLDEFHQSFLVYRQADVFDWMADIFGGISGAVVGRLYYFRRFDHFGEKMSLETGTASHYNT